MSLLYVSLIFHSFFIIVCVVAVFGVDVDVIVILFVIVLVVVAFDAAVVFIIYHCIHCCCIY